MKKSFRKTVKSNKKSGGWPLTRTSKYNEMKSQKNTLEETVDQLEKILKECEEKLRICKSKYPGSYPSMGGGYFGFSSASSYKDVKGEKLSLEKKASELIAAIEKCNRELSHCEEITSKKHADWNKTIADSNARADETANMRERETEPVIKPLSNEEFERIQELNRNGGRKRKTKKITRRKKGSRRRR